MGRNEIFGWFGIVAGAAFAAWAASAVLRPWLARHATAHPNARSSHLTPTPQGAGVAVVAIAFGAALAALIWSGALPGSLAVHAGAVAAAGLALMLIGLRDDIHGLGVASRLGVQAVALAAVIVTLPGELRPLSADFPFLLERGLLFLGGLWFLNLYNFMDGIDLITVTETVAIALGIALLAWFEFLPPWLGWTAAAVAGATLGFAPWNAPPARLFLGDAGSLPLGLLIGALLLHVASSGLHAVAWILPLYYLTDATVTVSRRLARGEKLWLGHRGHFYQAAMRNGFSVPQIVAWIAGLNAILIALSLAAAVFHGQAAVSLGVMAVALICVGIVLRVFSTPQSQNINPPHSRAV